MVKQIFLASILSLCACSTVEYTPNSQQPAQTRGVRVLFEYPQDAKFKSLGTVDAYLYKPGWKAPTYVDVLPKLKEKAASVGGNALIVRSHQVGQMDRSINVTAEVLTVTWAGE